MNEVVKAILEHKYEDVSMKKQVFICRRSNKKRIKDKAFTKLFRVFIEERPVTIVGEVVLVNNKYFVELKRIEDDLKRMNIQ